MPGVLARLVAGVAGAPAGGLPYGGEPRRRDGEVRPPGGLSTALRAVIVAVADEAVLGLSSGGFGMVVPGERR